MAHFSSGSADCSALAWSANGGGMELSTMMRKPGRCLLFFEAGSASEGIGRKYGVLVA